MISTNVKREDFLLRILNVMSFTCQEREDKRKVNNGVYEQN